MMVPYRTACLDLLCMLECISVFLVDSSHAFYLLEGVDELNALKQIVETDKYILPAVIKFQDQGKMTFPHYTLLPFM